MLAIDVSGSVDDNRFKLQREGIAAALESDELATVVAMGVNQTIEVAVIEWAEEQHVVVPWTVLHRRDEFTALARRVRTANRSWVHTKTDPGGGIAAAEYLLAAEPLAADRQVIDVSGDGRQNAGELDTAEARDVAVSHAVTVNGLPITCGDEPELDTWYRANVIGSPGSFLIVANGYEAFCCRVPTEANAGNRGVGVKLHASLGVDARAGRRIEHKGQAQTPAPGIDSYFTLKTQMTPPCGTLSLTPILAFASLS